jgi:hypothetical protein
VGIPWKATVLLMFPDFRHDCAWWTRQRHQHLPATTTSHFIDSSDKYSAHKHDGETGRLVAQSVVPEACFIQFASNYPDKSVLTNYLKDGLGDQTVVFEWDPNWFCENSENGREE